MTSPSCNFKSSKMKSPTKTNSSYQILTSSNPPLRNPNGNKVDNTNDLKHLEQSNDSFISQINNNLETLTIIKNSKKHSINSKTLIDEIINELENDGIVNSNQRSIFCEDIENINQCINFGQKMKSLEETIAKQI